MIKINPVLTRLYSFFRFFVSPRKSLALIAAPTIIIVLGGCSDETETSPFSEILSTAPFESITDSIRDQPMNDDLYFKRAVLLNSNNLPEPALADFKKAWSIRKSETYAKAIAALWMEQKPDSSIAFLNRALTHLPHSYSLRIMLARAYNAVNKTIDGLKICSELLKTYPNNTEILVLQSEMLEKRGDMRGSIAPLEKAFSIAPANMELGLKLAYKYAEAKNPDVIQICDMLIKRDTLKLFADPFYVKGVYYANINERAKAIHYFDETIRRNYNYMNAYIEKGKILLDQKKIKDAYKVFKLSNTIDPAFPDAYYYMGQCEEAQGQKQEAQLSYQKAYSLDKTFTEAKEAADRLGK